jgi:putative phage-type endonuclease
MQTHSLIQGSPEWLAYRKSMFNASDAPAMLGVSPYKTRSQLLHEMATGMEQEIDSVTQNLFNDGHSFEALYRPRAESIIGEELYPVTGSEGKLSASFDGLTISNTICWEHKSINDAIRAATCAEELPIYLLVQMEQQLMISGAEKCLFSASKWNSNDELIDERYFWYTSNQQIRTSIVQGWTQFAIDLAAYVPAEVVEPAVAAPTMNLPAVSVQVQGAIALISNLDVFGTALKGFISKIPEQPSTDQEFADCKSAIGKLQDAQDALDAAEANALGQIATFDEMRRTKALYFDLARTTRLALEKLVTKREAEIKSEIVQKAKALYESHEASLRQETGGPWIVLAQPDFAGAIKNKRTVASLQNAVDTALANGKIAADASAKKIRENLACIKSDGAGYEFLFNDQLALIGKPIDDLRLLIKSRINDHKVAEEAKESAKEEALRLRIAEEERIKAEAKVRAEQEAIAEAAQVKTAEPSPSQSQSTLMKPAVAWPFPGTAAAKAVETPTTAPTLTLGKIGARLGFNLTADFLRSIGFEPAGKERAAVLYHESSFPLICAALIEHISAASVEQPQAA